MCDACFPDRPRGADRPKLGLCVSTTTLSICPNRHVPVNSLISTARAILHGRPPVTLQQVHQTGRGRHCSDTGRSRSHKPSHSCQNHVSRRMVSPSRSKLRSGVRSDHVVTIHHRSWCLPSRDRSGSRAQTVTGFNPSVASLVTMVTKLLGRR